MQHNQVWNQQKLLEIQEHFHSVGLPANTHTVFKNIKKSSSIWNTMKQQIPFHALTKARKISSKAS